VVRQLCGARSEQFFEEAVARPTVTLLTVDDLYWADERALSRLGELGRRVMRWAIPPGFPVPSVVSRLRRRNASWRGPGVRPWCWAGHCCGWRC